MNAIVVLVLSVICALLWEFLFYDKRDIKRITVEFCISLIGVLFISYLKQSMTAGLIAVPIICWIVGKIEQKISKRNSMNMSFIYWVLAAGYTLFLFSLNYIRIFDNDFWADECYTLKLARMSVGEMCKNTALDVHPPLFYIFQIIGYRLFGNHGWVYHGVSLVPYALILIFSLTIIWKRFGKIPSVLMITFASILNNAVTYNVQARMYSWAALFVLLSFYGFDLILEHKKHGYAVFILSSLAAAYTHYYALMTVAFFYLALIIYGIAQKVSLKKVIITCLVTILGYLPWLLPLLTTFKRTSKSFWMTAIPTVKESIAFFFDSKVFAYSCIMFILTVLFVIASVADDVHDRKKEVLNHWLMWGIMAAAGIICIGEGISLLIRPAFMTRYLYPVCSVIWLVFSVGLSEMKFKKPLFILIMAVTLIICLPEYKQTYQEDQSLNIRNDQTVTYTDHAISKNDQILTDGVHLGWTIIENYVPQGKCHYISSIKEENFNNRYSYWLFWEKDLKPWEKNYLADQGYQVHETYHKGILGTKTVHIYRLSFKQS